MKKRTDKDRLDWLDYDSDRLEDVRGRVNNESETLREAIDWLMDRYESEQREMDNIAYAR